MLFQQPYKLHLFEPGETYTDGKLDAVWQVSIYQSYMGGNSTLDKPAHKIARQTRWKYPTGM